MKVIPDKLYAVITGDIVASSRLPTNERKKLLNVMKQTAEALNFAFGKKAIMGVDTFRGDGWQLVVTDPVRALRIGLFYRAFLRVRMDTNKIDTRMAIALGRIDFIPGKRISEGDGEAFRLSGAALEEMPRRNRICFILGNETAEDSETIDTVITQMDALTMNLTEKQAQAITGILQGWNQQRIAASWTPKAITQQAVAQHLSGAGWFAIDKGISFIEKILSRNLES